MFHGNVGRGQAPSPVQRLAVAAVFVAAMTIPAACNAGASTDKASPADLAAEDTELEPTAEAGVGLITSGTTEVTEPTTAPPERPTQSALERATSAQEAADNVPFGLLEPTIIPEDAHRDLVRILEAPGDEARSDLPAVRFVYTSDSGSLMVYQSPATGEAADGEAATIGDYDAWKVSDDPPTWVWEQDGVRLKIWSPNMDEAIVRDAAASMAPFGSWGGPAGGAPGG